MVGKQWSPAEERFFWKRVVPRSPKRLGIHRLNPEDSWDALAELMQKGMGTDARRAYTGLSLFEHWFQNVVLPYVSKHAVRYAAEYKNNMSAEEKAALERRQDDRARRPRTTKAKRDRAALAVTKAREKADNLRRRSEFPESPAQPSTTTAPGGIENQQPLPTTTSPNTIPVPITSASLEACGRALSALQEATQNTTGPSDSQTVDQSKAPLTEIQSDAVQVTLAGGSQDTTSCAYATPTVYGSACPDVSMDLTQGPQYTNDSSGLFLTDSDTSNMSLFDCSLQPHDESALTIMSDSFNLGNAHTPASSILPSGKENQGLPSGSSNNIANCQEARQMASRVGQNARLSGLAMGTPHLSPLADITNKVEVPRRNVPRGPTPRRRYVGQPPCMPVAPVAHMECSTPNQRGFQQDFSLQDNNGALAMDPNSALLALSGSQNFFDMYDGTFPTGNPGFQMPFSMNQPDFFNSLGSYGMDFPLDMNLNFPQRMTQNQLYMSPGQMVSSAPSDPVTTTGDKSNTAVTIGMSRPEEVSASGVPGGMEAFDFGMEGGTPIGGWMSTGDDFFS